MFKFEIHLHSSACSACGISTAIDMINSAVEHSYSGVVFTNHFYHGNTSVNRNLPWNEFVQHYIDDYNIAKAYGDKKGIVVLFGLEEVYEPGKEMLLYGFDPKCIKESPKFKTMSPEEISSFIHKNGGIVSAAHPFRIRQYIPDPLKIPDDKLFDSVEVYNYCNEDIDNKRALSYAKSKNLVMLSGGDIHNSEIFGHSGIAFFNPVCNNKQFVEEIKNKNYKLIINDTIVDYNNL